MPVWLSQGQYEQVPKSSLQGAPVPFVLKSEPCPRSFAQFFVNSQVALFDKMN